jgi:hypothetical protein
MILTNNLFLINPKKIFRTLIAEVSERWSIHDPDLGKACLDKKGRKPENFIRTILFHFI